MTTIASIIFAASITGGAIGQFCRGDNIRHFPESVSESNTPGGDSWYSKVNEIDIPNQWVVYRNGVVTNVPPPEVFDDSTGTEFSRFDKYVSPATSGCYVEEDWGEFRGDCEYYGVFDHFPLTCDWIGHYWDEDENGEAVERTSSYHAEATNLVSVDVSGKDVWLPKTQRLSLDTFASLVASYEAYYERLFYASAGENTTWDRRTWGYPEPDYTFKFNVANTNANIAQYLPDPAPERRFVSLRLREGANIYNLRDAICRLISDSCLYSMGFWDEPTYDSPAFVYRPKWFLDWQCPDMYSGYAGIWWSTTAEWPTIGRAGFIPTFSWSTIQELNAGAGIRWDYYSPTIDMLSRVGPFKTSGPYNTTSPIYSAIMNKFNYQPHLYNLEYYGTYFNDSFYYFLTNNFERSAKTWSRDYDSGKGFDQYRKEVWEYPSGGREKRQVLRTNTRAIEGCNQALSILDRVICVPNVYVSDRYSYVSAWRECAYASQADMPLTIHRKPGTEEWTVDIGEYDFKIPMSGESANTNVISFVDEDVKMECEGVVLSSSTEGPIEFSYRTPAVSFSPNMLRSASEGNHTVRLTGWGFTKRTPSHMSSVNFTFQDVGDSYIYYENCNVDYMKGPDGEDIGDMTFNIAPSFSAKKTCGIMYTHDYECYVQDGVGPYDDDDNRARRCLYGIFGNLVIPNPNSYDPYKHMLSAESGQYTESGELPGLLNRKINEIDRKCRSELNALCGTTDFTDLSELLAMPSSASVKRILGNKFTITDVDFDCAFASDFSAGTKGVLEVDFNATMTQQDGKRYVLLGCYVCKMRNGQVVREKISDSPGLGDLVVSIKNDIATDDVIDRDEFEPLAGKGSAEGEASLITQIDFDWKNMKRGK